MKMRNDHCSQSLDDVNSFQLAMMVDFVADATQQEFMSSFPLLTGLRTTHEEFHELHLVCTNIRDQNKHITIATLETEDDPQLPVNPRGKDMEYMIPEDKHLILENDSSKLVDCTVTLLNMLKKDLQQKILSTLTEENNLSKKEIKKEDIDDDEEEEHEARKEPVIPPPTKVSIEVQTDPTEGLVRNLGRAARS